MNVLVLAQYFPPDMGGGSTRASNVVKGLLGKGCNVTVVAAFPHYPHGNVPRSYTGKAVVSELFGTARVYRVWIPSIPHSSSIQRVFLHFCFVLSSLFALPFVGKIDVVWGANPNLFSFFPSIIYGFSKRIPIVRNVDDLWPEVFYELGLVKSNLVKKLLDFIAWFSYAAPVAITPISLGYKRYIISKYGVTPRKVQVIEVGVENVAALKTKPRSNVKFLIMYSGVLGLGYDFNVILEGAKLLEKNKEIVFIIRGVGELAQKLKKDIYNRGLDNVVLDPRFLPKAELVELLNSADVFVLPMAGLGFIDLGLPTKVFEYQAYGKPIICISGGEPARFVKSTGSGLVVKPNDAKGLVQAVTQFYVNRELGEEMGRRGYQFVSENLTTEKIGSRMFEILSAASERKVDLGSSLEAC